MKLHGSRLTRLHRGATSASKSADAHCTDFYGDPNAAVIMVFITASVAVSTQNRTCLRAPRA